MVATPSSMLPLGTHTPEFRLPAPDGSLHGPADVADAAGLLVVFLCNHCPYVKHVADGLGRLAAGWMDDGLAVLGVNPNDVDAYPRGHAGADAGVRRRARLEVPLPVR